MDGNKTTHHVDMQNANLKGEGGIADVREDQTETTRSESERWGLLNTVFFQLPVTTAATL